MSNLDIKFKRLTPFKRCVLQNFPFIEADFDALTNYGLLCKIVEYLNQVIASQNEVQGVTEEIVTAFNNLYDYVHDYFENLDVQEEINNKLDAMVEDGTLPDIVADYLNPKVKWTFNTVAEMQAFDHFEVGCFAQTLGYYAKGDGGESTYIITDTEPASYYETIDENLYAQLVVSDTINVKQLGAVGDGETDDSNAVDTALAYFGNNLGSITGVTGDVYKTTGDHFILSNTYINLNGSTLLGGRYLCDKDSICEAGYTGITNVKIFNGKCKGDIQFIFFHSTDITFDNIEFEDTNRIEHTMQIAGVKGLNILNCVWNGNGNADYSSVLPSIEAVQLELATSAGQPFWTDIQPDAVYDSIPCKNVVFDSCSFHKKASDQHYITAIGTHSHDVLTADLPANIRISNCIFDGWYRNAIHFMVVKNLTVENCTFIPRALQYGSVWVTAAIEIVSDAGNHSEAGGSSNIVIRNNTLISDADANDHHFARVVSEVSAYPVSHVLVQGNIYQCNSMDFMHFGNASDCNVGNNIIRSARYVVEKEKGMTLSNLNFSNNTIEKITYVPLHTDQTDTSSYYSVNNLNDNENIITKTIDDVSTNFNTSSYYCKCHLQSDTTFTDASEANIDFGNISNKLVELDSHDLKPNRMLRKIKVNGTLCVKGGTVTRVRVRVWDMVTSSYVEDISVRCAGETLSDWHTIEIPDFYLKDDILQPRSNNGPRYAIVTLITTSGSVVVKSWESEIRFSNW